jgi:hypothetical protein
MSRKNKRGQQFKYKASQMEPDMVQSVTISAREFVHDINRSSKYMDSVSVAAGIVLAALESEVENSVKNKSK